LKVLADGRPDTRPLGLPRAGIASSGRAAGVDVSTKESDGCGGKFNRGVPVPVGSKHVRSSRNLQQDRSKTTLVRALGFLDLRRAGSPEYGGRRTRLAGQLSRTSFVPRRSRGRRRTAPGRARGNGESDFSCIRSVDADDCTLVVEQGPGPMGGLGRSGVLLTPRRAL